MPSVLSLLVTSAFAALAASTVAAKDLATEELPVDDECLAENGGNQSECALNALQYRGSKRTSKSEGEGEADSEGEQTPWSCWGCMQGNSPPGLPMAGPSASGPLQHYALNCWYSCGQRAGTCNYCGAGNACCKYRNPTDPPECKSATFFPVLSFHTCVKPAHSSPVMPAPVPSPGTSSGVPGTTGVVGDGYQPQNKALAAPSDAPILSFYMYRAMGDNDYAPTNVNAANLAGIMWYLHNEVVVMTPRKFGITRIVRMKVQTKAPAPLFEVGMNFGVRYAFDSGKCTGPWSCDKQYEKYGYFVGCNSVGNFPTEKWAKANHYENAIWYSLPGPCSNRMYNQHDDTCVYNEPGGACAGTPTGRGNCTYSAEPAGEIRIDELEGISNYQNFMWMGGKEYIHRLDTGFNLHFWDGKADPAKCAQRVKAAEDLFAAKYGPPEPLATPKCDFWQAEFYRNSPH